MKYSILVAIAIAISASALAQNRTGTFEYSTSREGNSAKVIFTVAAFNPKAHKLEGFDPCNLKALKIDGREPLGVGICGVPEREISSIKLYYRGNEIMVPKELHSDCYQPPFSKPAHLISRYLNIKIGDDLRSVFVFMSGGDGAAGYQVLWVLREDGKHSRFSTGQCPDCRFIDFDSYFDDR